MKPLRGKIALAAAVGLGLGGMIAPQTTHATEATQQTAKSNQREGIQVPIQAPRVASQRLNFTSGANSQPANRFLNQRQYRKWMKQVPQMRRSKKCRIK